MKYRIDQEPIMEYEGGTMAVPAVPGAGKTFIVANLVAKLIEQQKNKPGKILIVTYMNSAVNNFKSRIAKILEKKGILGNKEFEVMTIHSLALKVLKDRPDIVLVNEDFMVVDDIQQNIHLNEAVDEWLRKGGENVFRSFLKNPHSKKDYDKWKIEFQRVISTLISKLKLNDITPSKFNELMKGNYDHLIKALAIIYMLYDKKLKLEGLIDYDDILNLAYKILEKDKKAREKFQNKYTYIFEDECQDSNIVQCQILKLLSKKNNNLVKVGDINQSITGTFSSSSPEFFKSFCKEVEHKKVMDMASRSSKDIIDLANYLVDFVIKEHPTPDCREALVDQKVKEVPKGSWGENPKPNSYNISINSVYSWEQEIEYTIKRIKEFKGEYPDKTIGVLVPFNGHVNEIALKLKQENIEYDELSGNSERKVKVAKTLGSIFKFLSKPHDITRLVNLIDDLFEHKDMENKKILLESLLSYSTEDILYPVDGLLENKMFLKARKDIVHIREILEKNQNSPAKLVLEIGDLLEFESEDKAMAEAVAFYIRNSLNNNPRFTFEDIAHELIENSQVLFRHMADMIYELNGYEPTPDRVTLCTYHKSKGLEWDCVFLLGFTGYNFPSLLSDYIRSEAWYLKTYYRNPAAIGKFLIDQLIGEKTKGNPVLDAKVSIINEKIRLLYVAITRAKEFLVLISHKHNTILDKDEKVSLYFNKLQEYIDHQRSKKL
ncbi:ATP-dependent helicase [Lutibacter sp. B2]|nr:ATP-dependent helicase [Lutibacter sp. B2]